MMPGEPSFQYRTRHSVTANDVDRLVAVSFHLVRGSRSHWADGERFLDGSSRSGLSLIAVNALRTTDFLSRSNENRARRKL